MHTRINLFHIMSHCLSSAARNALICLVVLWTSTLFQNALAQAQAEGALPAESGAIFGTVVDASTGDSVSKRFVRNVTVKLAASNTRSGALTRQNVAVFSAAN